MLAVHALRTYHAQRRQLRARAVLRARSSTVPERAAELLCVQKPTTPNGELDLSSLLTTLSLSVGKLYEYDFSTRGRFRTARARFDADIALASPNDKFKILFRYPAREGAVDFLKYCHGTCGLKYTVGVDVSSQYRFKNIKIIAVPFVEAPSSTDKTLCYTVTQVSRHRRRQICVTFNVIKL